MKKLSMLWLGLGAALGAGAAHAHATSTSGLRLQPGTFQPRPAASSEQDFTLTLEPASVQVAPGARETVEVETRVASSLDKSVKALVSVRVVNDSGELVQPSVVSPLADVPPHTETSSGAVLIPPLEDGWYAVQANAIFADPAAGTSPVGGHVGEVYLHVENGETFFVDAEEWNAMSNVNVGREEQ